ncbi:PQQ-binding-like beta-propeller repeat protein [Natrinema caseinilyticum]|uniref:PQQ-binding-like beta-propeller repeat protein n=1 Tax=Natrinema caseinilyticum TaxID=2961570 RepID=UPI0020C4FC06|nr:PQQ-binding-like beta-propeller repeat protein [Natrinema caseinilyticum]
MTDYGRRRFLTYAGLTVAWGGGIATATDVSEGAVSVGSTMAGGADGWSMRHGNAGNTGSVPKAAGPEQSVTIAWTYESEGSFAVVDETVYLVAADGRVHAIDATDGSPEWKQKISSGDSERAVGSPAVTADTVYVCGDRASPTLTALDAASGDVRWQKSDLGYETNQAPIVANGSVFLVVDKVLRALDADTGEKQWDFKPNPVTVDGDEYSGVLGRRPVAVVDETVFAVSNKRLFARNAETGDERWTDSFAENWATNGFSGLPIADGGVVAATKADTVVLFDTKTGEKRGELSTRSADAMTTARVYAVGNAGSDSGGQAVITGYDRETGESVWQSSEQFASVGRPIADDGSVYAPVEKPSGKTGLIAFDDADGSTKWSVTTDAHPKRIAVADGALYANVDGTLLAIRGENADETEKESNESNAESNPGFTPGISIASGALALEWLRRRRKSDERTD